MSWRTTLSVFKRNVISSIIYRSSSSCQKKKQESCAPPLPSEHGKANTFRLISLCVIPVILLLTFQVLINTERSEYGPPFVPYEHLRIRNKRFPWGEGQKSLFHHPDFNALPDGYEEGRGPPEKESEELEDDEGPEEVCNEITDVATTEESK